MASTMSVDCVVSHLEPRTEVRVAFANHKKAERVFGRRPNLSLDKGLRRMGEWVRLHGARESSVFQDIEVSRNLPACWVDPLTASSTR